MSDQPTSRRSVIAGIAVTAAAGIAGYSVARTSNLTKPSPATAGANGYGPSAGSGTFLADVTQVPPAGGGLILDKALVVLVREADGSIRGFSATCTHQGCTVASVQGGIISCPCHGSQFSTKNGAVVAGPAPRPLPSVAVVVRGAGIYTE